MVAVAATVPVLLTCTSGKSWRSVATIAREHGLAEGTVVLEINRFARGQLVRCALDPAFDPKELLIAEDKLSMVLEAHVKPYPNHWMLYFHYNFQARPELSPADLPLGAALQACNFFVRRVLNISQNQVRPLWQTHPICGELEVKAFGRAALVNTFCRRQDNIKVMSVPLQMFADGFGLYRNMYRSLMGVYLVNASLTRRERDRRANLLPLTLGPHRSSMTDVVSVIGPALYDLEQGALLRINGQETFVCAFTLSFLGDMP